MGGGAGGGSLNTIITFELCKLSGKQGMYELFLAGESESMLVNTERRLYLCIDAICVACNIYVAVGFSLNTARLWHRIIPCLLCTPLFVKPVTIICISTTVQLKEYNPFVTDIFHVGHHSGFLTYYKCPLLISNIH